MFEMEALKMLDWLFENHNIVVVTGGSGLYIKALCEGIDDMPDSDLEIRKELVRKLEEEGLESLRFELKKIDPDTWECIDLKNPNRILKALEISLSSGKPYSTFLTGRCKERDFKSIKIGLNMDRDELYSRINQRVEDMMEHGLLDEARAFLPYRNQNALKTVGYNELFDYLDGLTSLDEAVYLIKRNSRRYARRQLTWFKRDEDITWFRPDQTNEIMDHIRKHAKQ
jgi:tRNA dimethylallyltransferase